MKTCEDAPPQGVPCPECGKPMWLSESEPERVMFTTAEAEAIYVCRDCWITTKRSIKLKRRREPALRVSKPHR